MGKKVKRKSTDKYLIVKCNELDDQWECDAHRQPICITKEKKHYERFGYEIYEIFEDGYLKLIQKYEDIYD